MADTSFGTVLTLIGVIATLGAFIGGAFVFILRTVFSKAKDSTEESSQKRRNLLNGIAIILTPLLTIVGVYGVYRYTSLPRPTLLATVLGDGTTLAGTWYGPLTVSAADGVAGTAEVIISIQQQRDGRIAGTGSTCDAISRPLFGQYHFQVSGANNDAAIMLAFDGPLTYTDPSGNTLNATLGFGIQGTLNNSKLSLSGTFSGTSSTNGVGSGTASMTLQLGTQADFTSACASLVAVAG